MKTIYWLLIFFFCFSYNIDAQCGLTITSYPYIESFETGMGGWSSGGTGNDWAWGAPSKAFITSAGAGSKCWVTGGLTGSFYTNGQRSFVQGPCFNFTSLSNPVISMKIFWECENIYDGACLQSSIDNGLTWQNVGSSFDASDCMNQQWYNNSNIINLASLANPKEGWAGSSLPTNGSCQGGSGSNGWVNASHCLTNLGGQALVRLRFAFGAGTACNGFDGFAFDNIKIEEGALNVANFNYTCTGNPLQYQFNNTSTPCPSFITWNFGDPASGTNNGSGQLNPTHTFTSPGTYIVSLSVNGPCNSTSSISKTIITVGLQLSATNTSCGSLTNGSIQAFGSGGSSSFTYTLLPSGQVNSTGIFNSLSAGNYTVKVTDALGCSSNSNIQISSPPPITWNTILATPISCYGLQNGTIVANANGGSGSIQYTLNPGGITSVSGIFNLLGGGVYTIIATDASGCSISTISNITEPSSLGFTSINSNSITCFGANDGNISILVNGGTGPINYLLNPIGLNNFTGTFNNLAPGNYNIQSTDVNGCSLSTTLTITEPPALKISGISITKPTCIPNNNGEISISANGGTPPYSYSMGGSFSSGNNFLNLTSNSYTLTVKDAKNCSMSEVVNLQSENAPQFTMLTSTNPSCAEKSDGTIQAQAIGVNSISYYKLMPGGITSNSGQFINLNAGAYVITVADINQCTNTTQVVLTNPLPIKIEKLSFLPDSCGSGSFGKAICEVTGGNGFYKFTLSPGGIQNTNGIFENISPGNYMLLIEDNLGCKISSPLIINERICCEDVFVPNAFSPNGDGRNDEFKMLGLFGTELKEFLVFSRWGSLIFKARNMNDAWDGKIKGIEAEVGTYFYQIRYRCLSNGKDYLLKGDLILVR